jgi:anti-sigma factor RsiW
MEFSGMRDLLQRHIAEQRLSAYVDGRLGAHERQRVERHLQTCAACRRNLVELRAVLAMLRRAPARPVPRSFTLPLSVQNQQTSYRRWDKAYGALRVAAVAASLMLILFLSGDALITRGVIPIPDRMPAASAPMARTIQEYGEAEMLSAPPEEEIVVQERMAEEPAEAAPLAMAAPSEELAPADTPDEVAAMDEVPELAMEPRDRAIVGAPSSNGDEASPVAETEALALEAVEPQAEMTAEEELAKKSALERALEPTAPHSTPAPLRMAEPETLAPLEEPQTAEGSTMWRLWYAVRVASGILLGLVLVLLGGLIWIGQKRRI